MPKHERDRRSTHRRHDDNHEHDHGRRPGAGVDQRHILESFLGTLSALMIVVLILAPLFGARRERRRY